MALERMIIITMKNHIYPFENENRVQGSGMLTGLDMTGEVSDVYMLWWDETFLELLKSVDVEMDVFARFKDDINNILDELNCE